MDVTAELLGRFEIFHDLQPAVLDRLAPLAVPRRIPRGGELFSAGEARRACFLIVGGHVEV